VTNKKIKEEFSQQRYLRFKNISEGRYKLSEWIKFYNEERPHRSIEIPPSSKAYHLKGELKQMWKIYYGKKYSIDQLAG
jgi:hypothetical protein